MDEPWVLNSKPTYMILYNSVNVRHFSSGAETSIVIHQWFHAGWEVQHTVHQVAEGGGTCTYIVLETFIPSLTNSEAYPISAVSLLL